ncbi:hypothetical protein Tco_0122583 [Tanacetum coccineum]
MRRLDSTHSIKHHPWELSNARSARLADEAGTFREESLVIYSGTDSRKGQKKAKTTKQARDKKDKVKSKPKDFQEDTFRIISNPLFEFYNDFKSSNVNPLFEENDKDFEIKSSTFVILTSPEVSKLETYLEKDSIPPGIDLTLPPTFEVSSRNPTSPTLTGEKKPKPLSRPQEVEEIKEKEDEISSDVQIDTIVMPIQITFDNPIDFNDHFSKPKDLKKDLAISFDSTTTSILPSPLLDSDSPFIAELSARVTLNSLSNEDKVFKPEPSFLLPPSEPPDECLKNVVLNFYQNQKTFPLNVEDVNSFTFIIWNFLPFFTYSKKSPLIFSFRRQLNSGIEILPTISEASRVQLICPVQLELLILCAKLVWGDPYPFIIID